MPLHTRELPQYRRKDYYLGIVFKKKKMNEQEFEIDEIDGEKIPFKDKRRFNADGEKIAEAGEPKEPVKSANETALESKLKIETERREAAESKLGSVQVKFEEAKAKLRFVLRGFQISDANGQLQVFPAVQAGT